MSQGLTTQRHNLFPDSDGQPIADNTLQLKWIVMLYNNIQWLHANDTDVFVASDNLIYSDPTDDRICMAPDVYVAYGRPQVERGSYKLWNEGNIFPQVIIEVLSPRNSKKEMKRKREWYETHGCEEYLELNPKTEQLAVWVRSRRTGQFVQKQLRPDWTSPRLKTRFIQLTKNLQIEYPNGKPFLTYNEVCQALEVERLRADTESHRADTESHRADTESHRANSEKQRADSAEEREHRYLDMLRQHGIDPDTLT